MPTSRRRFTAPALLGSWALLAASIFFNTAAHAKLAGSTIHWQYYAYGAAYGTGSTFVATKPVTVGGRFLNYFTIASDRGTITFNYLSNGTWNTSILSLPPTIYNGIALNLASQGGVRSVAIDPVTNMPGFTASRVSFTRKQIQIDWQGLAFTPNTIVRLDIRVGGTAPAATQAAVPTHATPQPHSTGSTPP